MGKFLKIVVDDEGARLLLHGLIEPDLTEPMKDVAIALGLGVLTAFEKEGGPLGRWDDLTPAYATRKAAKWGSKPILQASEKLINSFVPVSDKLTADTVSEGVVYAAAQNFGRSEINLPARNFTEPFPEVIETCTRMIALGIQEYAKSLGYAERGWSPKGTRMVR